MTTEFTGEGALLHLQRMQQIRNLFDRSGWRFSPVLKWQGSDQELSGRFGGHNEACVKFRNAEGKVEGIRVRCQCDDCIVYQLVFCLENNCDMNGLGAGSLSVVHTGPDEVRTFKRERMVLEEQVEARKTAERARDLAEKAVLGDAINHVSKQLRREYERQRKREADKKRIKPFAKVGLDNIVRVVQ